MTPVAYSTCTWVRSFVIELIWSVATLKLIVKETITREAKKKSAFALLEYFIPRLVQKVYCRYLRRPGSYFRASNRDVRFAHVRPPVRPPPHRVQTRTQRPFIITASEDKM